MKISNILKEVFPEATIEAETDLTGAAKGIVRKQTGDSMYLRYRLELMYV